MNAPKIILDMENIWGYNRGLMRGIMRYSDEYGPWSFYASPGKRERVFPHLDNWECDGIVMGDLSYKRKRKLIPSHVPVVSVYEKAESGDVSVAPDSLRAGQVGAEYLLGLGFKNFAFCSFSDREWSKERQRGFTERLSKDGYKVHIYRCTYARYQRSWISESEKMVKWIKNAPKPLALMACNDIMGREVIEVCKKNIFHIPHDVAVLGADNDEMICDFSNPPLSSILFYTEAAGYEAARNLDLLMKGLPPDKSRVDVSVHEVIERQSTNILYIKDPLVAEAVHFIRRSAQKPVKVDDVVASVATSRRNLERRFKETLNCTVLDELRRSRIDMIIHLLLKTDDSITQIARSIGLMSSKNLSRYFKEQVGMTPQEYRLKFRYQKKRADR
ncbi:MAG: XylR family transcriptional regulator [Planctomycetota bacterium]|jgi:LacI family transcriptional regulator